LADRCGQHDERAREGSVMISGEEKLAEARVVAAEAEAQALEDAIRSGDTTITAEDLAAKRSVRDFLRLQVDGVKAKMTQAKVDARTAAIQAVKAEVENRAPALGADLLKALSAVEKAAQEFIAMADERDNVIAGWIAQLDSLKITKGMAEFGIGQNGIGELRVAGTTVVKVDGPRYLNLIFDGGEPNGGRLTPTGSLWRREAAYDELRTAAEGL
jgi:hypothetical protein